MTTPALISTKTHVKMLVLALFVQRQQQMKVYSLAVSLVPQGFDKGGEDVLLCPVHKAASW